MSAQGRFMSSAFGLSERIVGWAPYRQFFLSVSAIITSRFYRRIFQ